MRSRKLLPGSWVISTTIRSDSTRVPPVTAERSPPASRITGADSPVIADSSTEAMPSTTVPSPGITSPASTTTTSPRASSDAGRVPPSRSRATVSVRIARRLAACARPAALGQRLGQVGEDDGQPQPDRHGEREPGGLVAAAQRAAAEQLDEPGDGGDERRRSPPRTSPGCGPARAGRACAASRGPPGPGSSGPSASATGARRGAAWWASARGVVVIATPPVEGEVELEDVHAGLAEHAEGAAVGVVGDQLPDPRERQPADGGDAVRLDRRVGLGDLRVDARGGARHGVDRARARRSGPRS